jgi:methyl-accepting chemotaxis protein
MKSPYKIMSSARCEEVLEQVQRHGIQVENAIQFIKQIEAGQLEIAFESGESDNELAKALLSMQQKMRQIAQAEKQRNWATEGLAQFSVTLRQDKKDLKDFGNHVISQLVKYLNANQGAFFIKNVDESENTEYLELVATYAYGKKKYLEKKIGLGEGLTGQCCLERDFIYMTDVPKEYVEITSGLGEATPNSILIFPLEVNDEIFGVIELASFKLFEPFQIEFLKKLSESIASAISSVKISEKTNYLLQEAQSQSEELQAQDEELRQNMEEMEATNEEMKRQRLELETKDKELQKVLAEMRANEEDMNKTEDKNRKIVKDFLLLKKEVTINEQESLAKDKRILDQQDKIKALNNLLLVRASA